MTSKEAYAGPTRVCGQCGVNCIVIDGVQRPPEDVVFSVLECKIGSLNGRVRDLEAENRRLKALIITAISTLQDGAPR